MFDTRQVVTRGVDITLMIACFGYAQGDDANEYLAEVYVDFEIPDGADISTIIRTEIRATADVGGDQPDEIEEIVVIGKQKWRHSNLGTSSGTDPVAQKPGWIDWQFLPMCDPEQAYHYFDQFQLNEKLQRAGFIELFRARFGRWP